jgi:hypothetical protein
LPVAIPQNKAELLAQIDAETAVWERLLAEVGEERMLQPGATGDWTFKDVVAHLIGWRRRTLARLEAARQGVDPPPPPWPAALDDEEPEPINNWIYEQNRDRPLADVLAEAREQFRRMRELTAAIPEDALLQPGRFAWLEGWPLGAVVVNSFIHLHEEHEPTLRAWLQALEAER